MKIKKAGFTFVHLLVVLGVATVVAGLLPILAVLRESSRNERQQSVSGVERAMANAAVKHLYVISAYSGQVIIHSAVRGDVDTFWNRKPGYLRWRDTNGASHELYASDRTVIHISNAPPALKGNNPGAETAPRLEDDK